VPHAFPLNLHSFIKTIFYKAGYSVKKIRPRPASVTEKKHGADLSERNVIRLLHKTDPYEEFDLRSYSLDPGGWGGKTAAFHQLILEIKPHLIVEVGTWKGGSALEMAAIARDAGLSTQILCVDTWLGALEFWTDLNDSDRYGSLQLKLGYPTVYYQFLANVCYKGFQDRIVPFPQTASIASLWLRYYGITPEMVYIDASHEEEDVYQDLCSYWDVVADGGLLFGDDYFSWDGVRLAVDRFAKEQRKELSFIDDKWLLRKRS
jgi:hypothetical protein